MLVANLLIYVSIVSPGRRTPSPPELALVIGYAGAALCATVFHVLRTNRLGVDIPFTHSPPHNRGA